MRDYQEGWNWCFFIVVPEKTPESPLAARRSNQSILKEINPDYSVKGLMLKVKLQYLMRRADSLENTLMLGKIRAGGEEGKRGRDGWMASPTQGTWVWANSGRQRTGKSGGLQSMGLQSQTQHSHWTKQQQCIIEIEWHSIIIKCTLHQKNIAILDFYVPNNIQLKLYKAKADRIKRRKSQICSHNG